MRKFGYTPDKTLIFANIDVSHLFKGSMEQDLLQAIRTSAQTRYMTFQHDTCREEESVKTLPFVYCSGIPLAKKLDWLESFYTNDIIQVVSQTLQRDIKPIDNIGRAITVQALGNGMRVECHVDTYPTAANLYLQLAPEGGQLAISAKNDLKGYQNILNEVDDLITLEKMTLGIVNLNNNAHTVTYCWDGINERVPVDALPDITVDSFWQTARIAVNFNFDDPHFDKFMPDMKERMSIYHHINGYE